MDMTDDQPALDTAAFRSESRCVLPKSPSLFYHTALPEGLSTGSTRATYRKSLCGWMPHFPVGRRICKWTSMASRKSTAPWVRFGGRYPTLGR